MAALRRAFAASSLFLLCLIALPIPFQFAHASLTCSSATSPSWQVCGPVEAYPGFDLQPAALSAKDGTLWLSWTANHNANGVITQNLNVLYATRLSNGTWLHPALLSTKGGQNEMPTLAQTNDGTVYLFWSYQNATLGHTQIYYRTFNGIAWSAYTRVTSTVKENDTSPSAAVGRDGTLWLVWSRDNDTASGTTPIYRQLWYKTLRAGVWSQDTSLTSTSDLNWNWQPSIMVGKDGLVRIAFAKGQNVPGHFQIYYMTNNGAGWSTASPVASLCNGSSCSTDANPSIMQDRNGTLWLFWGRNMIVSSTQSDYVVFGKNSVDNGAHWNITETAITAVSCGVSSCIDSQSPAAVQSNVSFDKSIWVFYSTDPSITGFDIWGLKTLNPVYPVHDVTVSSFSASSTLQYSGGLRSIGQSANVTIYVTITNLGDFNETVSVTLTATNTSSINIGTRSQFVTNGSLGTLIFAWNTTGVRAARYGLSATAAPLPRETVGNLGDNTLSTTNQIHILPLGDVDQDGSVTITDVGVVYFNYGFLVGSLHNGMIVPAFADINGNGIIDIVDVGVVSRNYGTFS
jgi:hypothetical protein